jgi:hypothetical protein
VFTARYGLIPHKAGFYTRGGTCLQRGTDRFLIKSVFLYPWWKVFTARYGPIPYIKQVFIPVVESVYSSVRTDSSYKAGFYNRGGKCLQRGTDRFLI